MHGSLTPLFASEPRSFLFGLRRVDTASPDFGTVVASALVSGTRPRCCCLPSGPEMYIARSSLGHLLKRMPNTGSHHAASCMSYEPADLATGWGEVAGSAIREDPLTGETSLWLDFALSKLPGQSAMPSPGAGISSVSTKGVRLSLRGLLHFLWHESGLTRWHPGFEGKRNWALVRRLLLQAAGGKVTNGGSLGARLYVPEPFQVDQREPINARRQAQWRSAMQVRGRPKQLQLLIGEVKELVAARFGHKAVIKHLPDQTFAIDAQLYRRLERRFEAELSLWGASDQVRLVAMATFSVNETGLPDVAEITLMPVTRHWLPVENSFELELVERLVGQQRAFFKGLRYNLDASAVLANATLIDVGTTAATLCIVSEELVREEVDLALGEPTGAIRCRSWRWTPSAGEMPAFPPVDDRLAHGRRP